MYPDYISPPSTSSSCSHLLFRKIFSLSASQKINKLLSNKNKINYNKIRQKLKHLNWALLSTAGGSLSDEGTDL